MNTKIWAKAPSAALANLGTYSAFTWRRNWLRIVVWVSVTISLVGFVCYYYFGMFGDDWAALKALGDLALTPTLNALLGMISNPYCLGGVLWTEYWMFGSVMLLLGMLYLTTRNLRGDEDAGRAELMRAYPLGIHTRLIATVWINSAAALLAGLLTSPLVIIIFSPSAYSGDSLGAWLFGLSMGTMGVLGVGLGALLNQVAPTNGGANGLGLALVGLFYLCRLWGDVSGSDLWIWLSPIGWGQKVDPWGANRWWPALLQLALAMICVSLAWWLEARRDLGAGLVPPRLGIAKATRLTTTGIGLAIRTQRASLIGWLVGVAVTAYLLGAVIEKMGDILKDVPGLGLSFGQVDTLVAVMGSVMALTIACFAVQSISTLRVDEEQGLAEVQLVGYSRLGWVLRRLVVATVAVVGLMAVSGAVMGWAFWQASTVEATWIMTCLKATLIYLPAVALLMSVVVLGFGWWPRQAVAVAWTVLGAMFVVMFIGVAIGLPKWALDIMPFEALPAIPAERFTWPAVLIESGLALLLTLGGLVGVRRRTVPVI